MISSIISSLIAPGTTYNHSGSNIGTIKSGIKSWLEIGSKLSR